MRTLRVIAIAGIVVAGLVALRTLAYAAFDTPPGSGTNTSGCSTINAGGSCTYQFQFIDNTGSPDDGLPWTATAAHVTGCSIRPTSGTTSGGGIAGTTLSCSANSATGIETITVTACKLTPPTGCASVTADVTVNPAVPAGNTGNAAGNPAVPEGNAAGAVPPGNAASSSGGVALPDTSTEPPGANPWLIAVALLAAAVFASGGAYLMRARRRSA